MDVKPVSNIETPPYPKADRADAAALLSQHVPGRWSKAKGLAGAVAVALAANLAGGCGSNGGSSDPSPPLPSNPRVAPSASFAEANNWVRSIYGKRQSRAVLMGEVQIVLPPVREENAGGSPPHGSP